MFKESMGHMTWENVDNCMVESNISLYFYYHFNIYFKILII